MLLHYIGNDQVVDDGKFLRLLGISAFHAVRRRPNVDLLTNVLVESQVSVNGLFVVLLCERKCPLIESELLLALFSAKDCAALLHQGFASVILLCTHVQSRLLNADLVGGHFGFGCLDCLESSWAQSSLAPDARRLIR